MNRAFRNVCKCVGVSILVSWTACEKTPESPVAESADQTEEPEIVETGKSVPDGVEVSVDQVLRLRARQQAEGLGGGGVKVNGSWNYEGYSYLSPNPDAAIEARLVAVDITVTGHTRHFDLDDIEIVDGASLMSFGSDPHATPLSLDGRFMSENEVPDPAPKASRWLLIYAFPKKSPAFHLYYWGKALTNEPVSIGERGIELPYPSLQQE